MRLYTRFSFNLYACARADELKMLPTATRCDEESGKLYNLNLGGKSCRFTYPESFHDGLPNI